MNLNVSLVLNFNFVGKYRNLKENSRQFPEVSGFLSAVFVYGNVIGILYLIFY